MNRKGYRRSSRLLLYCNVCAFC